jgi:hypothetical protein
MHVYPYRSRLKDLLRSKAEDVDYRVWQSDDLQVLVGMITHPIIEIGGPTQDGFYFIDEIGLNTRPIITNISSNPLPFSADSSELAKQVAEVMDATKMDYSDNSIGIFLMAAMSISSDWWVMLSDLEKENASNQFEAEFAHARFEMGQVAAGVLEPTAVKDAQRIKIYLEVARCLQKDGLFFHGWRHRRDYNLKAVRF